MRSTLLIINADDFGLTGATCETILRLGETGAISSTSVLAVGRAAQGYSERVRNAGLGVGAHLACVGEDPLLLSRSEIPSLCDGRGLGPRSWRELIAAILTRRVDPADIRAEFAAQIEALRSWGLPLDHLNTHQHVHLFPRLATCLIDLASEYGIAAVRVPRSSGRRPRAAAINSWARALAAKAARSSLEFPEGFAGLDEAGGWDRIGLESALLQVREAGVHSAEIGCHPGATEDPDRDRFRWGYHWAQEAAALSRLAADWATGPAEFRLGTYADLDSTIDLPQGNLPHEGLPEGKP